MISNSNIQYLLKSNLSTVNAKTARLRSNATDFNVYSISFIFLSTLLLSLHQSHFYYFN